MVDGASPTNFPSMYISAPTVSDEIIRTPVSEVADAAENARVPEAFSGGRPSPEVVFVTGSGPAPAAALDNLVTGLSVACTSSAFTSQYRPRLWPFKSTHSNGPSVMVVSCGAYPSL